MTKMIGAVLLGAAMMATTVAQARDKAWTVETMRTFETETRTERADARQRSTVSDDRDRQDRDANSRARDVSPALNNWLDNKHPKPAGR